MIKWPPDATAAHPGTFPVGTCSQGAGCCIECPVVRPCNFCTYLSASPPVPRRLVLALVCALLVLGAAPRAHALRCAPMAGADPALAQVDADERLRFIEERM